MKDKQFVVKLPLKDTSLLMRLDDKEFKIKTFEWEIIVKNRINEVDAMVYSYEQDEDGPIAWILEAKSTIDSITKSIQVPVVPLTNGQFGVCIDDLKLITE